MLPASQMAVNTFGSGRSVYLSGLPYSFENNTLSVIVPEQTFLKFVNKKYGLILKVTVSEFIGRE